VIGKFENFCQQAINTLDSHKSEFEDLAKKRDAANGNYRKRNLITLKVY
jgi:hypothetical protein